MSIKNIKQPMTAGPVFDWFKLQGLLAMAGILGPLLLLGADILVPLSFINYSPVQDSISMLAWAGLGWMESVALIMAGLFLEVFAAALVLGIRRVKGFDLGVVMLAFAGFGLLMVGLFRTDIPYFPITIDGTIHGIASKATFTLLPLAILLIAPSLKKDPYWHSLFVFSLATAACAFIWMAGYKLWSPNEAGMFGLYERVLAAIEITWIEIMAFWLLRWCLRMIQTPTQVPVPQEIPTGELNK